MQCYTTFYDLTWYCREASISVSIKTNKQTNKQASKQTTKSLIPLVLLLHPEWFLVRNVRTPVSVRSAYAYVENDAPTGDAPFGQGVQKWDFIFLRVVIIQSEAEDSFQLTLDWTKSARKNVNK